MKTAIPDKRLPQSHGGPLDAASDSTIRDCAAEAVKARVTPDSADAAPLWALAWRSRSAAWMIRHRGLLENAITCPADVRTSSTGVRDPRTGPKSIR